MKAYPKRAGVKCCPTHGTASFSTISTSVCLLFMWMTSSWPDPKISWTQHGKASKTQSTLVNLNPLIGISDACAVSSTKVKLPQSAHPLALVFDAKAASAAAQRRTQDWWEHDVVRRAWIRHHIQPRKRLFDSGDEGGFSTNFKADRIILFDADVTMKACAGIAASTVQGGGMFAQDVWTESRRNQPLTHEFWTGRTIFTYGEERDPASFAVPSKNRPGPHRDKREAKKIQERGKGAKIQKD